MNRRGQALVEMAIFIFVVAPIIGLFLGFTRWFQIKEKLVMAAWAGAQLYSSGCVPPAEAERCVRNYLLTGAPALAPTGITIRMGGGSSILADKWIPSAMPVNFVVKGLLGVWLEIDRFYVSYEPPHPWLKRLGIPAIVEETCYIKHSPHYWDPITGKLKLPGMPAVSGPAIRWSSDPNVYVSRS